MTALFLAAWTWQVFSWNDSLWMRSLDNGEPYWEYRVGAGGAIDSMHACRYWNDGKGGEVLAPGNAPGDFSDRVIQTTTFALGVVLNGQPWNVNQTGSANGGEYSGVVSVDYYKEEGRLDVYTIANRQWQAYLEQWYSGQVMILTSYKLCDKGVIRVRKVVLAPYITYNGTRYSQYAFHCQEWIPFRMRVGGFSLVQYANRFHDYIGTLGANLFTGRAATQTPGSISLTKYGEESRMATVVHGNKPIECHGVAAATPIQETLFFTSATYDGAAIIMTSFIDQCEPGTMLDIRWSLMPSYLFDGEYITDIEREVQLLPAVVVYGPSATLPNELEEIRTFFYDVWGRNGARVRNLGSLLKVH